MEVYNVIVGFFQNGGVFMIPIVVILALGAAIAIERWVFLTVTTAKNKALWNAVTPYLKAGNFAGAMQVTSKSGAVIGQIMTYGLNRVRSVPFSRRISARERSAGSRQTSAPPSPQVMSLVA